MCRKKIACLIAFVLLLGVVNNASAANTRFTNGGGDRLWSNPSNWDIGVPTATDNGRVSLDMSGPLVQTQDAVCLNFTGPGYSGTSTMDIDGGTLTLGGCMYVGMTPDGHGTLNIINNGTLNVAVAATAMYVGYSTGCTGIVNVLSGGTINAEFIRVGATAGGVGTLTVDGGTVDTNSFWYGNSAGTTAYINLYNGVFECNAFGSTDGTGVMNITGGTFIVDGNKISQIADYITAGKIVGYGGSSTVFYDYDVTNAGKTTVTATTWECFDPPVGDFTGDCVVNMSDFAVLTATWLDDNNEPVYRWFDATSLYVPDSWNPDAWYRMATAPGVEYDLSAGVTIDPGNPNQEYEILIQNTASDVEIFAAEELQKYLFRITGEYIPIVTLCSGQKCLSVGNQLDARLSGTDQLEDDFVIVSGADFATLSGAGDRGTLYSIYTFLEKHLGCRWYYPDPEDEIVPQFGLEQLDTLLSGDIDEFHQSAMKYRELMILNQDGVVNNPACTPFRTQVGGGQEARDWLEKQLIRTVYQIDWMAKNRYNIVMTEGSMGGMHVLTANWDLVKTIFPEIKKRGLDLGIGGHFWTPYLNTGTPGWPADNSWGPLLNGQRQPVELCCNLFFCTTDYNALKTFLKETISFFRANPEFDIWANWPPDGPNNICECPICNSFSASHRIMRIHNQIAEALETEVAKPESPIYGKEIPVILIGYYSSSTPPAEQIPVNPNFAIMPDVYIDFNEPFAGSGVVNQWKTYLQNNGSGNEIIMFGRWCRSFLTGYHLLPPTTISDTIGNMINQGFSGAEMFHGWGGWWLKGLWTYTTAKALWDPDSISISILSDDYFANYFGPAAEQMRTFYETNEQAHANCPKNFAYAMNFDLWWGYQPHAVCTDIDPYKDIQWVGIIDYLDTMISVSAVAEQCFADARVLVSGHPDESRLLHRIWKTELSWEYFEAQKLNHKYQFDGLLYLEQGYNDATSMSEYLAKLNEAQQAFELSQQYWANYEQMVQDHTMLHNEFPADKGVCWDGGATWSHRDYSGEWLSIVSNLQNEAQGQTWPFTLSHPWTQHYPSN